MLDRLDRITNRAESHPEEAFNNLFSLLNYELLRAAFRKLQRDKAPGVDGVTVDQYEEHLQENLQDLLARLHRGAYHPQPSLRCDIPKGNGKTPTTRRMVSVRDAPATRRSVCSVRSSARGK